MTLLKLNLNPAHDMGEVAYVNPDSISALTVVGNTTALTTMCGTKFFLELSLEATRKLVLGELKTHEDAAAFDVEKKAKSAQAVKGSYL